MASSAALTTRAALSSQMLSESPSAFGAKSTPLQLASPIFGRKLAAPKAPAQQLKARSSVVTAAVEWKNVPGKLRTISIGDGGALIGTTVTNDIYHWTNNNWAVQSTGKLKQISTGAKGHWGVSPSDDVWHWDGTTWKNVAGKLKHVASGKEVWGVSADDQIWKRNNKPVTDTGLWDVVPGRLAQIDTNDFGDVWGVNATKQVFRRVDNEFVYVPGPGGQDIIKHVTTGVMGVWAVDTNDVIYRWVLSDSKDGAWHRDPKEGRLRNIDSGYDSVWGTSHEDSIWKYTITHP
ncbi:hypothetical protein KFL_001280110 [Klebsormidium nitens]|uniref:Uncharacterized protein n=1 Tax=Klebsormidium nitens TaxID=105231 RepID=A0A1Y1I142_KLENI|nr:hypothetical protein KFL_001280110 [Klebsormidium nitens]|eukprot:GAQ82891.1 hypothetical protein KFL_001280110 [Klebsormidium nitens]